MQQIVRAGSCFEFLLVYIPSEVSLSMEYTS